MPLLRLSPSLNFGSARVLPLDDLGDGVVVEDHVRAGEAGGGGALFLTVEGDCREGFVGDFEEKGAGAAGGVVDGGGGSGGDVVDADDFGDDARDFRWGVELAFAFAAFGGEVAHEVFTGVAEDVVTVGAVAGEVEGFVFEDGDEVSEAVDHFFRS